LFDAEGRRVARIYEGWQTLQSHAIRLDGTGLYSGTYFLRLETDQGATTARTVCIR
jgi:hypothetical protein